MDVAPVDVDDGDVAVAAGVVNVSVDGLGAVAAGVVVGGDGDAVAVAAADVRQEHLRDCVHDRVDADGPSGQQRCTPAAIVAVTLAAVAVVDVGAAGVAQFLVREVEVAPSNRGLL